MIFSEIRQKSWKKNIERLSDEEFAKIKWQKLTKNDVQKWYAHCIDRRNVGHFVSLHEITGIKPELSKDAENVVRKEWYTFFIRKSQEGDYYKEEDALARNGWCAWLRKIREVTGLKPLESVVQEEYIIHIKKTIDRVVTFRIYSPGERFPDLSYLKELQEATGIEPSNEVVQKWYYQFFKTPILRLAKELQGITGIKPKFSENVAQHWYAYYIENRRLDSLKGFQELTGIKPREDVVQEGYVKYLRKWPHMAENMKFCNYCLQELKKLREITGIKPQIPEDVVQGVYTDYIREGWSDNIGGTLVATLISQEGYAAYIKRQKEEWRFTLELLKELTEIRPREEIIQEGYAYYIRKGRLDNLKELRDATLIKPQIPEDVVQEVYVNYAKEGWLDELEELQKISRIKQQIPEKVVQEVYTDYAGKGGEDGLKKLREITGIEVPEELFWQAHDNWVKFYLNKIRNAKGPESEQIVGICIEQGSLADLKIWQEKVGTKPQDKVIQEGYVSYVRKGWFNGLRELQEITGIKPQLPEDVVQEVYADYAREGWEDGLKKLQEITGIKPLKTVSPSVESLVMLTLSYLTITGESKEIKIIIDKNKVTYPEYTEIVSKSYPGLYPRYYIEDNWQRYIMKKDKTLAEIVEKVTAGCSTQEEKARALQCFVQTTIDYDSTKAEKKDYRIRSPFKTLLDKKGDCKDTSVLYASLVAQTGLSPVLCLSKNHISVGVPLDFASDQLRLDDKVTYKNKPYYIVETTFLVPKSVRESVDAFLKSEQQGKPVVQKVISLE